MNFNEIIPSCARVIELTPAQFFEGDPNSLGFNGKTWEKDIQAVVVGGVAVIDRKYTVTKRGHRLFNRWLKEKFGYKL